MKSWLRLAAAVLLLPVLLLPAAGCGSGKARAAVITACTGEAQVKKAGSTAWTAAQAGQVLTENDAVQAGSNGGLTITFIDGSTIELQPETRVEIRELLTGKKQTIRLKQELGRTLSKVNRLMDAASRYEIETPAATAAVRGSQMVVEVVADGTTAVGNVEGAISVTAQGQEVMIPEGQHSTVVPGAAPGAPEAGTTAVMISSQLYPDAAGDLFNTQGQAVNGPDYLDIQSSRISFIDGKWILRLEMKGSLPDAATAAAGSLAEWNFLLDLDQDRNTGLNRPFIGNDIGYDWLGQLALENQSYTGRFYDLNESTNEAALFTVSGNEVEIILPAAPGQAANPPAVDWGTAVIYYRAEDPRDTPFYTDKAPNERHYLFDPRQSLNSAADVFSMTKSNPDGDWSYGWMPTDFSVFHLFTNYAQGVFNTRSDTGIISWYEAIGGDRTPCLWLNTGSEAYGAPTGWLSLHPGPGKEAAVLRWTAPAGGRIRVAGEFLAGDPGSITVAVRHNGREVWTAVDAGSFSLVLEAAAGDTVDFLAYGGYHYGNTPLQVAIDYGE